MRKDFTENTDVTAPQWAFVGCAMFAGVGQVTAGEFEEKIVTPRFAENGEAAGTQDAVNLLGGGAKVKVVQNGVAPDAVETGVGERELLGIGLKEVHGNIVGLRSRRGFGDVTGGQVERGDASAATGEYDGGHAVTAAVVEYIKVANVAQVVEGQLYPESVVQILAISKGILGRILAICAAALGSLLIVKSAFDCQAVCPHPSTC